MIRTLLTHGGEATRRQIAAEFLAADQSQLEYYEEITKRYPHQTLKRRGIVSSSRGVYRMTSNVATLTPDERAELVTICEAKIAAYIAKRQDDIWEHRARNRDPVPGTLRYQVILRAKGRCEACGISSLERAIQVDHIVPRSKGGSNDLSNLQALCSLCNVQKWNRDATDFRVIHETYALRDPICTTCGAPEERTLMANELAVALSGDPIEANTILIAPRRHVTDFYALGQAERNALYQLEQQTVRRLRGSGARGINVRVAAEAEGPHAGARISYRPANS